MDKWDTEGQAGFTDEQYPEKSGSSSSSDGENKGCNKTRCCKCFRGNLFLVFLILGIAIGVGMGLGIRYNHKEFREDKRNVMYLEFPGKLLVRMLKMLIVPLVFTSLVAGIASLPAKAAGRLGLFAMLYYIITTLMAVLLGMLLVATIKPGLRTSVPEKNNLGSLVNPADALLDLIRNLFPDNIIAAATTQVKTIYTAKNHLVEKTITNSSGVTWKENVTESVIDTYSVKNVPGSNILGVALFSILLGAIIGRMGDKGIVLFWVFDGLQVAIMKIINIYIWFTPVGLCFLLASKFVSMNNLSDEFTALGWYIMTVLVGLAIHGLIVLPVIYVGFTRKNPFKLMFNMMRALLTALGTASSAATMPLTLDCLIENAKVDRRVSRFMIPVGATINMDGTALYEAVASIYLAQRLGYEMDAGKYVTVSLTATVVAIGAAGVPGAGLVMMLIVLTAIGLPATGETLALILTVDWFLDRFRTMVNVWGDSIGAGVVEKLAKKQLDDMDDGDLQGNDNMAFFLGRDRNSHTRL